MKKTFNTSMNSGDGMSWIWVAGSRVALLVIAVVLLAMPLTEYFWDFDKFLRGGQDFEFGLLFVATICCLVMFLLQREKCSVKLLLSLLKSLCRIFHVEDPALPGSFSGLIAGVHAIAVPSPSLSQRSLPLQV